MTRYAVGIDPGKQGAIAVLYPDGTLLSVEDTPYTAAIPDFKVFPDFTVDSSSVLVMLEEPITMPGQSVKSTASQWRAYGAIEAWALMRGYPTASVRPSVWKKKMGITRDKASAIALARRLFPTAGLEGPRGGQKDGRAEALLLAEYGRRFIIGAQQKE